MRSQVTIPVLCAISALCAAPAAFAGPPPPDGSKPLSTILAQVEQKPDFRYIDEAELKNGLYKVEYYTKDGVEHKLYIDPQTGKIR